MASQDFDQLHSQIDTTVHTNGPTGKTTAPGLNALLHRLVTDLPAGSSLPADQLAALAAAMQPNAANPYATLADLANLPDEGSAMVIEQNLSSNSTTTVPSVVAVSNAINALSSSTAYNKIADAITANSVRTYYNTAADAVNGAGQGGTANIYSVNSYSTTLGDPTGTTSAIATPSGITAMTINMYGVALNTPDANTDVIAFTTAGTYVVNAYNTVITQAVDTNSDGFGWTIAPYQKFGTYDITVNNLNIVLPGLQMSAIWFRPYGTIRYAGNIYSPYVTSTTNKDNIKTLVATYSGAIIGKGNIDAHGGVTDDGNGNPTIYQLFQVSANGTIDWTGDINVYDNVTISMASNYGVPNSFVNASLILRNGVMDASKRNATGLPLFRQGRIATVTLDNYSILCDPAAVAISADKVILRGNSVVVGSIDCNTLQDERPVSTGSGSPVVIEQDLSSNSTTSVPSVEAVASALTGRFRGPWAASTAYLRYDEVVQAGVVYYALANFTSTTTFDASKWVVVTEVYDKTQATALNPLTHPIMLSDNQGHYVAYDNLDTALAASSGKLMVLNGQQTLTVTQNNTAQPTAIVGNGAEILVADGVRLRLGTGSLLQGVYVDYGGTANTGTVLVFGINGAAGTAQGAVQVVNSTINPPISVSANPLALHLNSSVASITGTSKIYVYDSSVVGSVAGGATVVTQTPVTVEQNLSSNSTTAVPSVAAVKAAVAAGGSSVTVEQNLSSNSTTSVPSVAAVSTAVSAKAPLASPVFTGTPTAPTPAVGSANTSLATTAFVRGAGFARPTFAPQGPNNYQLFGETFNFCRLSGSAALTFEIMSDAVMRSYGNTVATGSFFFLRQNTATGTWTLRASTYDSTPPTLYYKNCTATTTGLYDTLRIENIATNTWLVTPVEGTGIGAGTTYTAGPGISITSGQISAKVLSMATTAVTLLENGTYPTVTSDTFTVDPTGAVLGMVAFIWLGPSATQPNLTNAAFQLEPGAAYVAGKTHRYAFCVGGNGKIQVNITAF